MNSDPPVRLVAHTWRPNCWPACASRSTYLAAKLLWPVCLSCRTYLAAKLLEEMGPALVSSVIFCESCSASRLLPACGQALRALLRSSASEL